MEGKIQKAILQWVGVDSFVLRLLAMACELHNSLDEAHEVFCCLQNEGYFELKTAADMPRGQAAKCYRCVSAEELILARVRLVPKIMVKDKRLAEYIVRDCISSLRQAQPSAEVFFEEDNPEIFEGLRATLCELYRALARALQDLPTLGAELWAHLEQASEELREEANRQACKAIIAEYRP